MKTITTIIALFTLTACGDLTTVSGPNPTSTTSNGNTTVVSPSDPNANPAILAAAEIVGNANAFPQATDPNVGWHGNIDRETQWPTSGTISCAIYDAQDGDKFYTVANRGNQRIVSVQMYDHTVGSAEYEGSNTYNLDTLASSPDINAVNNAVWASILVSLDDSADIHGVTRKWAFALDITSMTLFVNTIDERSTGTGPRQMTFTGCTYSAQ